MWSNWNSQTLLENWQYISKLKISVAQKFHSQVYNAHKYLLRYKQNIYTGMFIAALVLITQNSEMDSKFIAVERYVVVNLNEIPIHVSM